jgi:hypothetical protein
MISRDTIFGIGSIVGYFSLFVGALGQACFMQPMTKPHLPAIVAVMVSYLPWLLVFTVTFTKQSFLPPRPLRLCLLFALCWFSCLTILAEIFYHLGYMPHDSSSDNTTLMRVLMHIGWFSSFYIIPQYVAIRRYESK